MTITRLKHVRACSSLRAALFAFVVRNGLFFAFPTVRVNASLRSSRRLFALTLSEPSRITLLRCGVYCLGSFPSKPIFSSILPSDASAHIKRCAFRSVPSYCCLLNFCLALPYRSQPRACLVLTALAAASYHREKKSDSVIYSPLGCDGVGRCYRGARWAAVH